MKTIAFFTPANRGDLHVSRELVKHTIAVGHSHGVERFVYHHRWGAEILCDIDGLEYEALEPLPFDPYNTVRKNYDNGATWAINTWYAASPSWGLGGSGFGMTLNTLVSLFKAHFQAMKLPWERSAIEKFIPRPNWSKFRIADVQRHLESPRVQGKKRVLFCNGPAMSGQTHVDDAETNLLLEKLVDAHPDAIFYYTDQKVATEAVLLARNAFPTDAVIGKGGCDLNENAFLGTKCDVIIGRASGPSSFCYTADILLDPTKTMIAMCNDERVAQWIYLSSVPLCNLVHLPQKDSSFLFTKISEFLK